MASRFVNLFKKHDLDERKAFQRKVHAMLSESFPDRSFSLSEDPLTLEMGETIFGLTNLKSNFLLSPQTDKDLRELIAAQFDPLLRSTEHFSAEDPEWSEARFEVDAPTYA